MASPGTMVVIQPTTYCNLDCSYCYLPHRDVRRQMPAEVLRQTILRTFEDRWLPGPVTLLWHAGEPLAVPKALYREAFELLESLDHEGGHVHSVVQTNGTLINAAWAGLFERHDVAVGISLDGPRDLHDRNRTARGTAAGTHERALRGVDELRRVGIEPAFLCVLSVHALQRADDLFDFFAEIDAREVAFNIEEVEGVNSASSLDVRDAESRLYRFYRCFFRRCWEAGWPFVVREFEQVLASLSRGSSAEQIVNHVNQPFRTLTVDVAGNVSTYSPELSGWASERYAGFRVGNVMDQSFREMYDLHLEGQLHADVQLGVSRCRASCRYWRFCGGGAPSNKWCEHADLTTTETLACRLQRMTLVRAVIDEADAIAATPRSAAAGGHDSCYDSSADQPRS